MKKPYKEMLKNGLNPLRGYAASSTAVGPLE